MSAVEKAAGDLLEFQPPKKADKISDRRTPELVLALVGPIGSSIAEASEILKSKLEKEFQYDEVKTIKVSSIIKDCAHLVGESRGDGLAEFERIKHMQDVGNKLRSTFGGGLSGKKMHQ